MARVNRVSSAGLAVAAALLCAAPALADWPLGSQELGPAPGNRSQPSVAASRHGVLAVWSDARSGTVDLLAARMNAEGRPLETIRIGGSSSWHAVATDGESHVVLWTNVTLRSAAVDREGGVIARDLGLKDFIPTGLVWNGSLYLATSSHGGMVLLDRHGSIASGVLTIVEAISMTAASSATGWLVAARWPDRRGMVDVADFPPVGESKVFDVPHTPEPMASIQFAAFLGGFVSVEAGNTNELVVQLYDSSGEPFGEAQRFAMPERFQGGLHFTVRNRSLYIAYRTCTAQCPSLVTDIVEVRFRPDVSERSRDLERSDTGPGRSPEITLLGTMSGRSLTSLVGTAAGVLAFTMDGGVGGRQIYSALVGSEAFRTGGTLLSVDRARQRSPRIVSAAGRHLVAWIEEEGGLENERSRVACTILENDGRPISEGILLPIDASNLGETPEVASDGVNFLLVWSYHGIHGLIVSRDGEILRPPFPLEIAPTAHRPLSVAWNGVAYVISTGERIVLLGSDGTTLEPNPAEFEDFPRWKPVDLTEMLLARDGDTFLILGIEYDCPPFGSHCSLSYETAVRQTNLRAKAWNSADRVWNGRTFRGGSTMLWPAAIAAGGGHRLLVWSEFAWSQAFGWSEVGHVVGDAHTFDFETDPESQRPSAVWTGSGFLVTLGPTFLRHDPSGFLLERRSLGDDVRESNIAMGSVPFVVIQREAGVSRLFVRALDR